MKKIQEDSVENNKMFIGKNNVHDYILFNWYIYFPHNAFS